MSDSDIKTRALSLLNEGNAEAAYSLLRTACSPDNKDAETWFLFAGASANLGRFEAVAEGCQRCVELDPNKERAWYNLGLARFHLGQIDAAISAYQSALSIEPNSAATLGNLGAAWLESNDPQRAIEYCNKALKHDPHAVTAINTLGTAYREQGRYEAALDAFERGAQLEPENANIRWNLALTLLKCGNFQRGWDEFEWRWRYEKAMQRTTPYPAWRGLRPAKSLLVYMEQGIGDQIMFASCLPDLLANGSRVIVECEPRLVPLFERSFPGARFHGGSWDERLTQCQIPIQCQIPMGSLPHLFRRDRAAFPAHTSYLAANEELVSHWRTELAALGNGLKIGISWRGGNDARTRAKRAIPLQAWREMLKLDGTICIDIQYGDRHEELQAARDAGMNVCTLPGADAMTDLDNFGALLKALDLVVTVDNSTLHLAGALGVETWGLLPYDSDWRWEAGKDRTLWYPRVRLFKQTSHGDWISVIQSVSAELATRVAKP